jgi:hypothetical protein
LEYIVTEEKRHTVTDPETLQVKVKLIRIAEDEVGEICDKSRKSLSPEV